MKKRKLGQILLNAPYLVWAAIFIIVPMGVMAWYSFTGENGSFTIENFTSIFTAPSYRKVFITSLVYAFISTVICLLLAYPIAYFISQSSPRAQRIMVVLVTLPMWTSILIRTYSWLVLLEDNGLINLVFSKIEEIINLIPAFSKVDIPSVQFLGKPSTVILGMVYNFLPFMILPIYSGMSKMDRKVIEAAQDLGCGRFNVLARVIIPLSVPGVVSGITMVFVPAVSTFYISQKLGRNMLPLVGDIIENKFKYEYNYHIGAAFSLVLMILILICTAIMNKFTDGEDGVIM